MIVLESIIDGLADIRNHLGRTLLQLLGVVLGVASIVATFSLAAAGKAQAMAFYEQSGGIAKIFIVNKPLGKVTLDARAASSEGLTISDALAIKKNAPMIDLVSPVAERDMVLRYGKIEKTREVTGITPDYSPMNDFRAQLGRFITDTDILEAARVVVMGSDRSVEFFGSENPVGQTLNIGGAGYKVVGVMEKKEFYWEGSENAMGWMNKQIFVPVTTLVTRGGESAKTGKVAWIYTRMRDVTKAKDAVAQLENVIQREHGVRDFDVISRVERLKQNEDNNKIYDITFMVCGIISLFVGGIVVMNIQLASFNERVREVGVRKAVGASGLQIFSHFMSESLLVAMLGGFLGIFAGKFFTIAITSLIKTPTIITPQVIIYALIFAAGTGLVFGMYPAIRASRLNPIEALRTE